MHKKFRFINELYINENNILSFKQKILPIDYLLYGILPFFFLKSKKEIAHIDNIKNISCSNYFFGGNTIIIKTKNDNIKLYGFHKKHYLNIINYLKTTKLASFIVEK